MTYGIPVSSDLVCESQKRLTSVTLQQIFSNLELGLWTKMALKVECGHMGSFGR
jgi:hypothetical protein